MRVLTISIFATILSAPAFAADLGTYRPGTPYGSLVAPAADVCDSQCAGDAQCRGWNYVKSNPSAPGVCEFLSSVSTPIASQISISGVNVSAAPYSSRLTAGGTNTVRVGTQPATNTNSVKVGQSPSGRRIIRQAPPQRITPQQTVSSSVETMSLTEQQNRYRQAQSQTLSQGGAVSGYAPQARIPAQQRRQQISQPRAPQAPVFRQHLDSSVQRPAGQVLQKPPFENPQFQQPQYQNQAAQQPRRQTSRRATGPRRAPAQPNLQPSVPNAPQYQGGQYQGGQYKAESQGQPFPPQSIPPQQYQAPPAQSAAYAPSAAPQSALRRGSPRPPVGQPIPPSAAATQAPARTLRSTPSQRLAQLTAETRGVASPITQSGPVALTPEQASKSLFGRLHDDVKAPENTPGDMPIATSVPTQSVTQQNLDEVLAGGR